MTEATEHSQACTAIKTELPIFTTCVNFRLLRVHIICIYLHGVPPKKNLVSGGKQHHNCYILNMRDRNKY